MGDLVRSQNRIKHAAVHLFVPECRERYAHSPPSRLFVLDSSTWLKADLSV